MSTLVNANFDASVDGVGIPSSLVQLLRWRSTNQHDQVAFIYLPNGEEEESRLTYGELDHQAQTIATVLQASYQPGTRALLLYPPGLEFIKAFFGCLYAGVIAIPAYPPHPARLNRTLPKLQAITLDAEPAVVLTTSKLLASTDQLFQQSLLFKKKHWLATDSLTVKHCQSGVSRSAATIWPFSSTPRAPRLCRRA
jgi:acyl-CoA synthetase (AMP-forming)/AMP-acid ligase II